MDGDLILAAIGFTKVDEVYKIWDEILSEDDFLLRPRMSRIYYKINFMTIH